MIAAIAITLVTLGMLALTSTASAKEPAKQKMRAAVKKLEARVAKSEQGEQRARAAVKHYASAPSKPAKPPAPKYLKLSKSAPNKPAAASKPTAKRSTGTNLLPNGFVPKLPTTATARALPKPREPNAPTITVNPSTAAPKAPRPPKQAALDLLAYVKVTTRAKLAAPGNPIVFAAQRDMGKIDVDGDYGPQTRARGKALTGTTFPLGK